LTQQLKTMAIVYFHRRKDTNEIFYVGIGKKKYRARDKQGRNKYWWNIVNKVGYDIEIVHHKVKYKKAMELEIHYIKEFGRRDLGLGNLVNLTDGGNVKTGYKHNEESKKKISKSHKNKTITEEHIKNLVLNHKGTSGIKYSKETKKKMSNIQSQIRVDAEGLKSRNQCNTFRKLTENDVIEAIKLYRDGIMNYYELGQKYNVSRVTISRAIRGVSWKYLQVKH